MRESVDKITTYYHTIRYLRPVQIYGRIWFRIHRPRIQMKPAPPLRRIPGRWVPPADKPSEMISPTGFRFLNESHELNFPEDWNGSRFEKLWLYNLHYFDVLNSAATGEQKAWHRSLLARWVADNPPGWGNGWEPYPISLRIVNWIKWALAGNSLESAWIDSLAQQANYLSRRLEWHLLGNHLFANVKALVFAGLFFEGKEADRWLSKGLKILDREIDEQILPDGGHFELSPMYHSIILEDLLDLLNLFATYPGVLPLRWRSFPERIAEAVSRMLCWLDVMTHPDGEIALFNDAAFGIAPSPVGLHGYAGRLGLGASSKKSKDGVMLLPDSGYCRCERESVVLIADVGKIGPDYLPGHAHADTLGFEMSVFGQRIFVDSGTSCYGNGVERLRQRSTAAHNTLTIDGENSSEVWGGFRVARRAYPRSLKISEDYNSIQVSCAHDGFKRLPGQPIHRRRWQLEDGSLRITDSVKGRFNQAIAWYHLHPDVSVESGAGGKQGWFILPDGHRLIWHVKGGTVTEVPSTYHPRFGVSQPARCLEVKVEREEAEFLIAWNNNNAYSVSD